MQPMGREVPMRLSVHRQGTRKDPRDLWSIGFTPEFAKSLPKKHSRVKMEVRDGILHLNLSDQGILITTSNWACGIGLHHIEGFGLPDRIVSGLPMLGYLDEETYCIKVVDYPDVIKDAIRPVQELIDDIDPKVHQPATHFQEDVRAAEAIEVGDEVPLPVSRAEWHDNEIRSLRLLLNDLRIKRPDVQISIEDGMVKFAKVSEL